MKQESKNVFVKIDFIARNIALGVKFTYSLKEAFKTYSNDDILKIITNFGYRVKYLKSDNFFCIKEKVHNFGFQLNIILKGGIPVFVFNVYFKDEPQLDYCGTWAAISISLGHNEPIRKPIFRNYDELQEILKDAFSIYEDFKKEVIRQI